MKSFCAGLFVGGLTLSFFTLYTEAQQTDFPFSVEPGSPFAAEIVSKLLEDAISVGSTDIRNAIFPGIYRLQESQLPSSSGIEVRVVTEDKYYNCEKAGPFFVDRMIRRRELNRENSRQ